MLPGPVAVGNKRSPSLGTGTPIAASGLTVWYFHYESGGLREWSGERLPWITHATTTGAYFPSLGIERSRGACGMVAPCGVRLFARAVRSPNVRAEPSRSINEIPIPSARVGQLFPRRSASAAWLSLSFQAYRSSAERNS